MYEAYACVVAFLFFTSLLVLIISVLLILGKKYLDALEKLHPNKSKSCHRTLQWNFVILCMEYRQKAFSAIHASFCSSIMVACWQIDGGYGQHEGATDELWKARQILFISLFKPENGILNSFSLHLKNIKCWLLEALIRDDI